MERSKKDALSKLGDDTKRFLKDHGLSNNFFGKIKLALIVEYWAVLHFRMCEYKASGPFLIRLFLGPFLALNKPLVEGMSACRLRHGAIVGGGLLLHHSMGVAIAVGSEIGRNCTISSGVVIGFKADGRSRGAPKIGDDVTLMVGCKVLGDVVVGDGAIVGANAVVLVDVPAGAIAVGVPARIIFPNAENQKKS